MPTSLTIRECNDEVIVDMPPTFRLVPMLVGALLVGGAGAMAWRLIYRSLASTQDTAALLLPSAVLIFTVMFGVGLLHAEFISRRIKFTQYAFSMQFRLLGIATFQRW